MRILLIDVNCKSSSTGKIVYDLYTNIRNDGDCAAICYGRGANINEEGIYKFGLDWETKLHALLTRLTGFTGCFSYFSTRRLLKFIEEFQPDVVHIHELHAYFVNIKPLITYLKKHHIKTVMTLHCEFAYTGKCGLSLECEQWKTECKKCPRLRAYVSTLWFDHTNYMFQQKKELLENFPELTVATPSEWLSNRAAQSFLKGHKIVTIHNGIDTNVFKPVSSEALRKKYSISEDEKIVLALAPHLMSDLKGGHFVERLAEKMKNVRFIFVGVDGETERIQDNKIFLGPIRDPKILAQYYSLADVFVICSKRENFPTTCLEAQCCGTPVCGFDVGGVKETVLHVGENNSCVPFGDVDSLENVMSRLFRHPSDITVIAEEAKKNYGKKQMYEQYCKIYLNKDV